MTISRLRNVFAISKFIAKIPEEILCLVMRYPQQTLVFFLLCVVPASVEAKDNHSALRTLLDKKMIQSHKVNKQKCEKIKDKILTTVGLFPHSKNYIEKILQQPDFTIKCTDVQEADDMGMYLGGFDPETKTIYYSVRSDLTPAAIHHEYLHADNFFRHSGNSCKIKSIYQRPAPIFPINKVNINAYNEAFEKGDERVRKFAKLLKKLNNNGKISDDEETLYQNYIKVIATCDFSTFEVPIDRFQYKELEKLDWDDDTRQRATIKSNEYGVLEIFGINAENNHFTMRVRATDKVFALIAAVEKSTKALKTSLSIYPPERRLGEREAMTFEALSEDALKTFYPEAYALRQKHMQQCDYPAASEDRVRLDL